MVEVVSFGVGWKYSSLAKIMGHVRSSGVLDPARQSPLLLLMSHSLTVTCILVNAVGSTECSGFLLRDLT